MTAHIKSIRILAITDDTPDTSTIGEYTDTAEDHYIDRHSGQFCADVRKAAIADALEEWKRSQTADGHYVTFNTIDGVWDSLEDDSEDAEWIDTFDPDSVPWEQPEGRDNRYFIAYAGGESPDLSADSDYRKYALQDFARMESMNGGDWCYLGIRAGAEIVVNGVSQEITSGGLWGVESDSGDAYLSEVGEEEAESLKSMLLDLGFSSDDITAHMPEDLTPVEA